MKHLNNISIGEIPEGNSYINAWRDVYQFVKDRITNI